MNRQFDDYLLNGLNGHTCVALTDHYILLIFLLRSFFFEHRPR